MAFPFPFGGTDQQEDDSDDIWSQDTIRYGQDGQYGSPRYTAAYPQYGSSTASTDSSTASSSGSYIKSAVILGIMVTMAAFTAKATVNTTKRYAKLTPRDIARLNNIKLVNPHASQKDIYYERLFAQYPGGFKEQMSQTEALLILGINQQQIMNLTPQVLKSRHRKMMILNHPDRGGSPYLAMKVNTARDLLDKTFTFKR